MFFPDSIEQILYILLFLIPGYVTTYFINIYSDFIIEKDVFERMLLYVFLSTISAGLSYILLLFSNLILSKFYLFGYSFSLSYEIKSYIFISIIISTITGVLIGKNLEDKHLHQFFNTSMVNFNSQYAMLENKLKKTGGVATLSLTTGENIRGKIYAFVRQEFERDYSLILKNPEIQKINERKSKFIPIECDYLTIDLKDSKFIEWNHFD